MMKQVNSLSDVFAGQVAVLRVDPYTGIPVNSSGQRLTVGEAEFICFESEEVANNWALKEMESNPLNEFVIFDNFGKQIAVLHAEIEIDVAKKKPKGFFKRIFGK